MLIRSCSCSTFSWVHGVTTTSTFVPVLVCLFACKTKMRPKKQSFWVIVFCLRSWIIIRRCKRNNLKIGGREWKWRDWRRQETCGQTGSLQLLKQCCYLVVSCACSRWIKAESQWTSCSHTVSGMNPRSILCFYDWRPWKGKKKKKSKNLSWVWNPNLDTTPKISLEPTQHPSNWLWDITTWPQVHSSPLFLFSTSPYSSADAHTAYSLSYPLTGGNALNADCYCLLRSI